jgi:hypothetical protein
MYRNQGSRLGAVAPLVVRSDGRVVQLPAEALRDWPIRYIMTFRSDRHPLWTAFAALFGARR